MDQTKIKHRCLECMLLGYQKLECDYCHLTSECYNNRGYANFYLNMHLYNKDLETREDKDKRIINQIENEYRNVNITSFYFKKKIIFGCLFVGYLFIGYYYLFQN